MGQKEQRRSPRKEVTLNASVTQSITGKTMPVRTLNLSKRGTLVEADAELFPDDVCTFKLVTNDARVVELQGRIVWVKRVDGIFQAGVSFRNLSVDEDYILELVIIRSGKK